MKRILVAILALVLIFSLTAVAFGEKYKVVTEKDRLNVRDPVTHAEIGKLARHSTIEVNKIKGGWAYITYKGKEAICWAHYLKKVSGPESPSTPPSSPSSTKLTVGGKAKVFTSTGQNLNLREAPALDSKVLRVLSPGYHVTVLEIQSKWVKVKASSYEGWVWKANLKPY